MRVCDVAFTRDDSNRFLVSFALSHPASPHPVGDPRPSPAGSPTWSVAAAGSAGSFPRPAGAPWRQQEDGLVGHSLSRCLADDAADAVKLDLNPIPQLVV